jgi:CRP-like cAMP-binding protein
MTVGEDTVRILLALRGVAAFDMLSDTELMLVAGQVRLRHFTADTVLLAAGTVADMLFVVIEGQALTDAGPAPAVFDAPSALFGLPARSDYRAGPGGLTALCLAKPHLFTIARECPDFVVGLATAIQERA